MCSNLWQTGVQVYDTYYVESPAGGTAFTAPLRVSTESSNPDGSSYNNLMEQFLRFGGAASSYGKYDAIWILPLSGLARCLIVASECG